MENYKRLQRLGRGAQGSVYVAEHLLDKKKYVIKMVECNDASEAGKAFKEVQALQVLKHPYICGYKESFVTWEKEEEAMYVCIVMDYYGLGDLARILRQHREKKEQIEDMTLRKWLGQMIEALHFIHGNGMIHRDLKPSNIFMNKNLSISIGDFGVATHTGDLRTRTRTAVGSMSWIAPEILETAHYDERSDVWSLGCVVLELATCSFLSNESVTGLLFQIKLAPQVVEEALDRVAKEYSAALCHFIRATLRRAFQQRPTVKQLLELPYIQECLALSQSKLCTGTAKVGKYTHLCYPPVRNPHLGSFPQETTIKEVNHMASADVLLYMEENTEDPQSQVLALKQLFDVIRDGSQTLDDSGKRQVLHTMVKFISNAEIQVLCCHMLGTLATTAQQNDVLFTKEFISPICLSMRTHAGSKNLQRAACSLIVTISLNEHTAGLIGEIGGIQDILATMRTFPNEEDIVTSCCSALWSLSVCESNVAILSKEKGPHDICEALKSHIGCVSLVESACSALWSLSMEESNLTVMDDLHIVELLLHVLEHFMENVDIAKVSCAALASLVEVHDPPAFHILHTRDGKEGVPILLKALNTHLTHGEVVENIAILFQEMTRHSEIEEELASMHVKEALTSCNKKLPLEASPVLPFCLQLQNTEAHSALSDAIVALESRLKPKEGGRARSARKASAAIRARGVM
ncbi:hypothetical protein EMCRGX_G020202 [Ephydatia muelleri]